MKFRMGEYFSGPGGLAKGAYLAAGDLDHRAMIEHAWAVDVDEDSCKTYRRNITGATDVSVMTRDVRGIDVARELTPIDGFSFGFPCNDFSLVGERRGFDGDFGGLYRSGIHVLNAFKPRWFVAENVGGIRSANQGRAFDIILSELTGAGDKGYDVVPHFYKFEEYGVPQARHRVIIVGIRRDLGLKYRVPSPEMYSHVDVSARTALDRPILPGVRNNERIRNSQRVIDRLNLIDPGENAFNAVRMTDELKLNVNGATLSHIYRRLDPNLPSYTVTGSGGGGTHVYHWAEPRALTNRERARLQTFDDGFAFDGGRASVRKQIGMAVPVFGARAIFKALFQTFLGEDYPSVEPNLAARLERALAKSRAAEAIGAPQSHLVAPALPPHQEPQNVS